MVIIFVYCTKRSTDTIVVKPLNKYIKLRQNAEKKSSKIEPVILYRVEFKSRYTRRFLKIVCGCISLF